MSRLLLKAKDRCSEHAFLRACSRSALARLFPAALAVALAGCARGATERADGRLKMEFADANLLDVVAEGKAAILVAQITRVVAAPDVDEDTAGGTAELRVVRALTPQRWHGPAEIETGYAQYKSRQLRLREGGLGWNGLDVQADKFVLLAVNDFAASERRSIRTPAPVSALAVAPLESADDATVRALERVLTIEATDDAKRRTVLLKDGLASNLELLSGYCHYALGRLHRLPRESAIMLELEVLADEQRPLPSRLDAQANLELELWQPDSPTDPLNRRILAGLLSALLSPAPGLQRPVLLGLYSLLVSDGPQDQNEAATYRSQLVQGLALPPKDRLLATLQAAEQNKDLATEAAWLRDFVSRR